MIALLTLLAAAAPLQWSHSGRVLDTNGEPLQGEQSLTISLFDAPSGGVAVWDDVFTVPVEGGYYSVYLGSQAPLDLEVIGRDRLYLQVNVGGDQVSNRQLLAVVPYATQAYSASELSPRGLNARSESAASCAALNDTTGDHGDGLYWLDPNGGESTDAFLAYCEMDLQGGGWTLAMNVDPTDGGRVIYPNTAFWQAAAEYGSIGSHFVSDYASPAAASLQPTEILIAVARPGPTGQVFGWKHWTLAVPNQPLKTYFTGGTNTVLTTAVLGEDSSAVYAYEALIGAPRAFPAHSDQLTANRAQGPNTDQTRIAASSYSPHSDDNQAGLGTRMNWTHTSNQTGERIAYMANDVELWVNSSTNLWCNRPVEGSFKTVGSDTWCGDLCDACYETQGPSYYQAWTYRIYVR